MPRTCLYLATCDPTVPTTGTTVRGGMLLDFLCRRYRTHAVYLRDADDTERRPRPLAKAVSVAPVPYSPWSYFIYSRALERAAAAVLEREPVNFIFADFEKAGWYAWLLSRRHGTPFVYSSHNVEYRRYADMARVNPIRYLFVPYLYAVERAACRRAALTFAISESDAAAFRAWTPPDRLLVRPCAFDEERIHPRYAEMTAAARPTVLFVGNYRNTGNRDAVYIIRERILPQVVERHPEVLFRFVGNGFPADVRHPNLQAAGFVSDLLAEYARATVIIAPIAVGGGIKIKVIEAIASGKPLIATTKAMEGIPSTAGPMFGWCRSRISRS